MTENKLDRCPKCSCEIRNDVECEFCGIFFEKYFQAEARKKTVTETVSTVENGSGNYRFVKWAGLFVISAIVAFTFIQKRSSLFSDPNTVNPVVIVQESQNTDRVDDGPEYQNSDNDIYQSAPVIDTSQLGENVNLTYEYYSANADSKKALRAILNDVSPIRKDGKIYHGHADWHVDWNYHWQKSDDGMFKIKNVSTELTCKITLPKLIGFTSKKQRDQFDTFLVNLNIHERGHIAIIMKTPEEIEKRILALHEMSSAELLESAANNIGHQTLKEFNGKSAHYDIITDHGKTQGAWLD